MLYQKIISIEHLFQSWNEFKKDKRLRPDVQIFERSLEDNLFALHEELKTKTYQHSPYTAFNIYDPKFRHIHKAIVRDRVVHHAVVSFIEPIFDRTFIYDSYSCRKGKGTHKSVRRLALFVRKVSNNYTGSCFVLKLDIKKFFASVDHQILLDCVKNKVTDNDLLWLIQNIIGSFSSGTGIPIGNLTSQIFANIYLNELDQFIKYVIKEKYYIRYCDDFVIVSNSKENLADLISKIDIFIKENLKLSLHQQKKIIRKYTQGIDFLGYVVLPHYILPRTKTKRRIYRKLKENMGKKNFDQSLQSYLGYLSHAKSFRLAQEIKNLFWSGL